MTHLLRGNLCSGEAGAAAAGRTCRGRYPRSASSKDTTANCRTRDIALVEAVDEY